MAESVSGREKKFSPTGFVKLNWADNTIEHDNKCEGKIKGKKRSHLESKKMILLENSVNSS